MGFGLKKYDRSSHIFNGLFVYQFALAGFTTSVLYNIAKRYHFFSNVKTLNLVTPFVLLLSGYYSRGVCMHLMGAYHNVKENNQARRENLEVYDREVRVRLS